MDILNKIQDHIKAQTDFFWFCANVLGYREDKSIDYYDLVETHKELCEFTVNGGSSQLILMPRESIKSQIITIGKILWRLVKDPNLRVLIYSDSSTKAQGFLYGIKTHIEGKAPNSRFREMYPGWETDPHSGGVYNESKIVVNARKHARREPSVDTSGIESSKVGNHYDIIVFDDIVSDLNTTTKAQMDKVYECYTKSLSLLKRGGEVILVGTRWHGHDTYGRIIDENKGDFKTFIRDCYQEKNGKLIFEDIGMTKDWLDKQRVKQGSYLFSCLYRNNPVDDETALFKESDFRFYVQTPNSHKNLFITCVVDPAGEGEDFTAFTVCGMDKTRRIYLLDAVNEHLKPSQIVDTSIRLNYKWGFDRFGVEKNFFKGMLEKELDKAIAEHEHNVNFKRFSRVELMATCKDRTFSRVLSLQPYHERGDLVFPNDGGTINTLKKVYSELAVQMMQFTIDGSKSPHDDLLVSLAYHIELSSPGGEAPKEGPPMYSPAWLELQNYEECQRMNRKLPRRYRKNFEMVFN